MPRANRRAQQRGSAPLRIVETAPVRESLADGDWYVRASPASGSDRRYLCPGCQQELFGGVAHVVVWPADGLGGLDDRRHWHTPCWRARWRRPPRGAWR